MLRMNRENEEDVLLRAAESLCIAARTAPKGKGRDLICTLIASGPDKDMLVHKMREIAKREGVPSFERDAGNIESCRLLVLIGTAKKALGLKFCGFCGFADCAEMEKQGGSCAYNSGDLGIAVGSAVSRAADLRLDNRIMYTAGKAALELDFFPEEIAIALGIPLCVTGKSPFFDRV